MNLVKIYKQDIEYPINITLESPYLKFKYIKVINNSYNVIDNYEISLKVKAKEINNGSSAGPIHVEKWEKDIGYINKEINLNTTESISVVVENFEIYKGVYLELYYENIPFISISKPFNEFHEHIGNLLNQKILFSAPFGQGKSTFLDLYFTEKNDKYNVFKIYPVNYSIASNEDIFRYIKTDILYQLIDKNIDIEINNISFSHAAYELAISNKSNVIFGFIKLFTALGKNSRHLTKVVTELESAFNSVKNHQLDVNQGELKLIKSYLSETNFDEGSLYEDNLYTQLIRDYLKQLKNNNTKKNVLLIEDLDRIDPDHIFRILNVISAHIDIYRNAGAEQSNKFDFDKIVLVADVKNIEYIYEHRYGANVDFYGYLNKFFSTTPFYYDNNKVQKELINQISLRENRREHQMFTNSINSILHPLCDNNLLTLRELFKLLHDDIYETMSFFRTISKQNISSNGLFMPIIGLLLTIQSDRTLINKIEICKQKKSSVYKYDINKLCKYLIAPLAVKSADKIYTFKYLHLNFSFIIDYDDNFNFIFPKNNIPEEIINIDFSDIDNHNFLLNDFYDLFILNIRKYQEIYINK